MKKVYKQPLIEVIPMQVQGQLLDGSNTATNAGVNVTVEDWENDED